MYVTYADLFQFCLVLLGVAMFMWTTTNHDNKKK